MNKSEKRAVLMMFLVIIGMFKGLEINAKKSYEAKVEIETHAQINIGDAKVLERENLKCSEGVNKSYMSYKMITDTTSNQYRYIKDHMTVNEKGFLVDSDNRIGIALGSYFGAIGSKFDIELENGTVLRVVKIEAKDDSHTNNGCEQKWDKSVIEFVIDVNQAEKHFGTASNGYINQGNYNNVDEFNGAIKTIYKAN